MIYAYKHLAHRIENFHANIAYFFEQLFANDLAAYDENLLLQPAFIPIVNRSRASLKNNLSAVTIAYHELDAAEKLQVQQAFEANADIENLCSDVTKLPVKYDALPNVMKDLLKTFLTKLWEDFPLNDLLKTACGTVQEHFVAFVSSTHQQALVCPFCGLYPLKPSGSINRNAYDHYIPKAFIRLSPSTFKIYFPFVMSVIAMRKKRPTHFITVQQDDKYFFRLTQPIKQINWQLLLCQHKHITR